MIMSNNKANRGSALLVVFVLWVLWVPCVLFVLNATAAEKLRIGYGAPSVAMSVLWITKEGKLFEKNNLDVEVLYLESALVQRALIAGNIAFGEMTGSLMSAPRSTKATRWRHSTLRIIGTAFDQRKRTSVPPRPRL